MNISGIVVQSSPENVDSVAYELGKLENCTLFYHDNKGRIIITIEGESVDEEMNLLRKIQNFPHVISAEMSYSFSEDEMDLLGTDIDPFGDRIVNENNNGRDTIQPEDSATDNKKS